MHLSIHVLVLGVYTCTSIRCVFITLICSLRGREGKEGKCNCIIHYVIIFDYFEAVCHVVLIMYNTL